MTSTRKLTKKLAATVGIGVATIATLGFTSATSAAPTGRTDVRWNPGCSVAIATSTKDISNVVYMVDGVENRVEFSDGTHSFTLPGEATDIWVKAGNNKSGRGPGYGEHYARPASCDVTAPITITGY